MTYPQHPAIHVRPYPNGCDIIPYQSHLGWTAAIRGTRIRVFDSTQQIATADPWNTLTHPAPPLLLEWVALAPETAP